MNATPPPPNPLTVLKRFWRVLRLVNQSNIRARFIALAALLVGFALLLNSLNVLNSKVNKWFMDALEVRNRSEFIHQAWNLAGVFALSTFVAVFYKFTEERFGLLWRGWLTSHLMRRYLANRSYLRVVARPDIDNPEQRITEDVKNFTTVTLSFMLIFLNAFLSFYSFSWVLWEKTPTLFFAAMGYSIIGTIGAAILGRRLVGLNSNQLAREADLRYQLICVREYADQLAVQQDEGREGPRLRDRLRAVVDNYRSIVAVNRNIGFFSSFYDYLKPQLVPLMIIAPFYFQEKLTWGDVFQSMVAFTFVANAFSVFVTEFRKLSEFAAIVARVCSLWEAIEAPAAPGPIEVIEDPARLAVEHLSLVTPRESLPLITDLTFDIRPGQRLLVVGATASGKSELLRALAGLATPGSGRVYRPKLGDIAFVPQVPYLANVPLRDLVRPDPLAPTNDDDAVLAALTAVGFDPVLARLGGLEAIHDWSSKLSLGEQHLLALARLLVAKPKFAVLDETFSGLEPKRVGSLCLRLTEAGINYVTLDTTDDLAGFHDTILLLDGHGGWKFGEARESPEKYIG